MSQYIHIFARQNDQFIPLYSESRSNYIYEALEPYAPYERVSKITLPWIYYAIDSIKEKSEAADRYINQKRQAIAEIAKMNNNIDDKLDVINEYLRGIANEEDEKLYINAAHERLIFLKLILEDMEDTIESVPDIKDLGIYAGIDCGIEVTLEDVVE